ncbi:hypothetical protein RDI58_013522 [Solanum bulbocastanum]|uniref:F-box associated domain-containing protein n=1 Tax=Solanum bulbocastanum TaxID=147425 RepID=A0AAN8TQX4_SOLBU
MLIRSVCKSGYELLPDPELVHLQLFQAVKNNPYFIFHFDYPIKNQLYWVELSYREHKGLVSKLNFPLSTYMLEFNLVGSFLGGRLSAFLANRCGSGLLGIWIMKEYSVKESWEMMLYVKPYSATRFNYGKNFQSGKSPRFLRVLKRGEILLEYTGSINA